MKKHIQISRRKKSQKLRAQSFSPFCASTRNIYRKQPLRAHQHHQPQHRVHTRQHSHTPANVHVRTPRNRGSQLNRAHVAEKPPIVAAKNHREASAPVGYDLKDPQHRTTSENPEETQWKTSENGEGLKRGDAQRRWARPLPPRPRKRQIVKIFDNFRIFEPFSITCAGFCLNKLSTGATAGKSRESIHFARKRVADPILYRAQMPSEAVGAPIRRWFE